MVEYVPLGAGKVDLRTVAVATLVYTLILFGAFAFLLMSEKKEEQQVSPSTQLFVPQIDTDGESVTVRIVDPVNGNTGITSCTKNLGCQSYVRPTDEEDLPTHEQ